MRTSMVIMLVSATALAGCSDDGGSSGSGDFATARALLDAADGAAKVWDAQAILVGAAAAEGKAGAFDSDDRAEAEKVGAGAALATDPAIDGKAGAWLFAYRGGSGVALFVVEADGKATKINDQGAPTMLGQPIDRALWKLDSSDAMVAAKAHDAAFAGVTAASGVVGFSELGTVPNGTLVWQISVFSPSTGDGATVFVSASSGKAWTDVLVCCVAPPVALPPIEQGSESGAIGIAGAPVEHRVTLTMAGHQQFAFRVSVDDPVRVGSVHLEVTDPAGTVLEDDSSPFPFGGRAASVVFADDPVMAGTYSVSVSLGSAPQATYTLSWCSDGPGEADEAACDEIVVPET